MPNKLSSLIEAQIIDAYTTQSLEVLHIAEVFQINPTTIYNILKRNDLALRRGHRIVNDRAFAKPKTGYTAAQKYWAGFLLADGCISVPKQGNPSLMLGLQDRDRAHVEKFAAFLGSTHLVRWNSKSEQ